MTLILISVAFFIFCMVAFPSIRKGMLTLLGIAAVIFGFAPVVAGNWDHIFENEVR